MSTDRQDTTPSGGKYANERLIALYDRVERLEHAIEVAGAFLERGIEDDATEVDAKLALQALKAAIVQTFRSILLTTRETADEQLDEWLAEATQAEAEAN